MMFDQILARLNKDLNASNHIIPLFKQAIKDAKNFLKHEFESGEPVLELVQSHSDFMDAILRLAWYRFTWNENKQAWRKSRVALFAIGGYGRRELLPNSDVDVLILLERENQNTHRANIQSFTTLLWDIGLEVGHSVRSIRDCRAQAAADVTVMTGMLEARQLIGDSDLNQKLVKHFPTPQGSIQLWIPKRTSQTDKRAPLLSPPNQNLYSEGALLMRGRGYDTVYGLVDFICF